MGFAEYSFRSTQHSHSARGTEFHGLQFEAEGQEILTVSYTSSWVILPDVCIYVRLCDVCSRQGAMQSNGLLNFN